jgi:hypothetical protein
MWEKLERDAKRNRLTKKVPDVFTARNMPFREPESTKKPFEEKPSKAYQAASDLVDEAAKTKKQAETTCV